jgi:hypothetical protein
MLRVVAPKDRSDVRLRKSSLLANQSDVVVTGCRSDTAGATSSYVNVAPKDRSDVALRKVAPDSSE